MSEKKVEEKTDEVDKTQWKAEPGSKHQEFGGPIGCVFILLFSHFIVYYLWVSVTFNNGSFLVPSAETGGVSGWSNKILHHIQVDAAPTKEAAAIYWGFLIIQAFLAMVLPGIHIKGLPVPSEGNRRLDYNCNGISAWYIVLFICFSLSYFFSHFNYFFAGTFLLDWLHWHIIKDGSTCLR